MQDRIGAHGVKWGIIIGLVYCAFLFLRYNSGAQNPVMFGLWIFLSYIVVLILLLVSGFQLRKNMGGFIELKEAFKGMFIAVLIFELFFAVYNFIYLKYVNPNFYYQLKDATEAFLENNKQSADQIRKTLDSIDVDAPKKMNFIDFLRSYLSFVAISGIFAFIFGLIIKRKRGPFQEQEDNFLQPQA